MPEGYATRDSEAVEELIGELGFIIRRPPEHGVLQAAGARMRSLLDAHGQHLRFGYRVPTHRHVGEHALVAHFSEQEGYYWHPLPGVAAVHRDLMLPELHEALSRAELAFSDVSYTTVVALQGAAATGRRMMNPTGIEPRVLPDHRRAWISDQVSAFVTATGWGTDNLASELGYRREAAGSPDFSEAIGLLALQDHRAS
ncbi:hypothetical protein [Streptomyces sp. NPDC047841]|uniref:hypothetical protein n=1 Tax=Streptomyces sp. NPDC047841 TaxID=3154708 RepID=UPI003456A4CF